MERAAPDTTLVRPLTSIRFFAALAVVAFHSGGRWVEALPGAPAPLRTFVLNGYVGVTFFFVLSGFILHYTYRGRLAEAGALRRYGVARVARVYPVYLLALLAMLPFVAPRGLSDLPQFVLLQSWLPDHLWHWRNWNMPAWTLSVELFFYLCFPLLSAAVAASGRQWLRMTIVVLLLFDLVTASSSLSDAQLAPFDWMRWIPVPLLRLPEFVIGICAAELHLRRGEGRFPVPAWLPALALAMGLCLTGAPRIAAWATAMSVLLIAAIAADPESWFARLLSARWLVLLGGASYALYLLHQPVHFAVVALLGNSKAMVALQFPVLIALSVPVFLFYEEPVREFIRTRAGLRKSAIAPVAEHPTE